MAQFERLKKKRSIFLAFYTSYKSANGRTLGFRGQNFAVNSNIASVRSGWVGLESYEPRLVFRVWARKSKLRVVWRNMTSDSDSTQNFGSYRVLPGQLCYFCTEFGLLIFLYDTVPFGYCG